MTKCKNGCVSNGAYVRCLKPSSATCYISEQANALIDKAMMEASEVMKSWLEYDTDLGREEPSYAEVARINELEKLVKQLQTENSMLKDKLRNFANRLDDIRRIAGIG